MCRMVQNPFRLAILFKCNVHNPNPITFDRKIFASAKIKMLCVIMSPTATDWIGKITDIWAAAYADEMNLYHGTC